MSPGKSLFGKRHPKPSKEFPLPPSCSVSSLNEFLTDGNASLLRAARSGNVEKIVEHLKGNVDINTSNANGLNALHLAAKEGHVNVVTELLKRGANVNAATKKGNTALHIASLAGQEEVVRVLIQLGANVNVQSQNGFTPLYMAAQENHDSVVAFLLANGANQSLATEDGFTPLAVALQQGHDRVVAVLLENDTKGRVRLPALHIAAKKDDCKAATLLLQSDHNPDVTSKSGFTPLHIAAHYGNENIAKILLSKGADANYAAKHQITPLHVASKWGKMNLVVLLLDNKANIGASTKDGLTPLHCAARSGHDQVVDLLLEKGAPFLAKTKNGLAPLHMASQGDHVDSARLLLYHKAPVDDVTVDYLTALHVAAHCGHVKVAKLLLDRKADPNARALNGFTPLHIACKKNRIKVVELLLKHGASIEATTESGLTPLHVASFMGCMNIVIFLIQNGASPDVPTVRGETPLHLAARANQTDIIRILLRNGASVDARAREDQTPLHIAARLGNVDIVSLLLQHGAAVDATTKDMYTALHIAAKEDQEEVASFLLDHGASLTSTTKKGFTPLHLAAKYGNIKVARLLIQKDAPVDAQGKNGVTPLHVAAHYDHVNVALLLLDRKASAHAMAKNGYTPLHIAAKKNQMDIAGTLLDYGAKTNCESKAGFTPLHLSAQEGHSEMSTLLIEHKADVNHKANNGLTPLHLCAQEDRVNVASILAKNKAEIGPQTKAGYTPLHVASHFGQIGMVRFLLQNNASLHTTTTHGYTPLHQAAQQGHTLVVNLLLENAASPNVVTSQGQTPLSIAQRLGYISVVETLKVVTETIVTTTTTTVTEEKYKVVAPETMQETFMTDSEDEGGADFDEAAIFGKPTHATHVYLPYLEGQNFQMSEEAMLGDQSYGYLTADEMKSLGDDSLPIDVTKDEKHHDIMHSVKQFGAPMVEEDKLSPQHGTPVEGGFSEKFSPDNIDLGRVPVHAGFLVSFMVDARGGAMRGCRHSGVRIIIPPRKAAMPMRITCRYLRKEKLIHPPPLMEGEACASRILEMGPVGARFLGPVIIEVPHFAATRGKEREITILRSDTGDSWREHTLEASEEAVQEVLNESFEGEELSALEDLNTNRITRILTTDFPQYFAIVSRIRQEVHGVGPEGGMVSSTVVPQVQAIFPEGALTKKIRVGLQAQPIAPELVAKLLGNRVAVSPIVTVEPRRRKFHKPITLTIPVPQAATKGMINQYSGDAPTLRLLCSITGSTKSGGSSKAQWEDVTGSTPLTFVNDCVSFTTTVSARFWLMDCRQVNEVTRFATELYQEAVYVPFMSKFVVFAKRSDPHEAQLRVFCMTDDKEDKTLECQENFTEVAKSRDVEVLEGKMQYLEFAGNIAPVTKSGEQLQFAFDAFHENRLPFLIRVKDPHVEPMGRIAFMREPKAARGEPPQVPICNLNVALPDIIMSDSGDVVDLVTLQKRYDFIQEAGLSKPELIHRADLRLSDIAQSLDKDWVALAQQLDLTEGDISQIRADPGCGEPEQALMMLRLWLQKSGYKATGNELEKGLRKINREDVIKDCMFNVELVTDDVEKAVAKVHLDQSGFDVFKEELGSSREASIRRGASLDISYDEQDIMKEAESAAETSSETGSLFERDQISQALTDDKEKVCQKTEPILDPDQFASLFPKCGKHKGQDGQQEPAEHFIDAVEPSDPESTTKIQIRETETVLEAPENGPTEIAQLEIDDHETTPYNIRLHEFWPPDKIPPNNSVLHPISAESPPLTQSTGDPDASSSSEPTQYRDGIVVTDVTDDVAVPDVKIVNFEAPGNVRSVETHDLGYCSMDKEASISPLSDSARSIDLILDHQDQKESSDPTNAFLAETRTESHDDNNSRSVNITCLSSTEIGVAPTDVDSPAGDIQYSQTSSDLVFYNGSTKHHSFGSEDARIRRASKTPPPTPVDEADIEDDDANKLREILLSKSQLPGETAAVDQQPSNVAGRPEAAARMTESETWPSLELDTSQVSISSLPEDEKSEHVTGDGADADDSTSIEEREPLHIQSTHITESTVTKTTTVIQREKGGGVTTEVSSEGQQQKPPSPDSPELSFAEKRDFFQKLSIAKPPTAVQAAKDGSTESDIRLETVLSQETVSAESGDEQLSFKECLKFFEKTGETTEQTKPEIKDIKKEVWTVVGDEVGLEDRRIDSMSDTSDVEREREVETMEFQEKRRSTVSIDEQVSTPLYESKDVLETVFDSTKDAKVEVVVKTFVPGSEMLEICSVENIDPSEAGTPSPKIENIHERVSAQSGKMRIDEEIQEEFLEREKDLQSIEQKGFIVSKMSSDSISERLQECVARHTSDEVNIDESDERQKDSATVKSSAQSFAQADRYQERTFVETHDQSSHEIDRKKITDEVRTDESEDGQNKCIEARTSAQSLAQADHSDVISRDDSANESMQNGITQQFSQEVRIGGSDEERIECIETETSVTSSAPLDHTKVKLSDDNAGDKILQKDITERSFQQVRIDESDRKQKVIHKTEDSAGQEQTVVIAASDDTKDESLPSNEEFISKTFKAMVESSSDAAHEASRATVGAFKTVEKTENKWQRESPDNIAAVKDKMQPTLGKSEIFICTGETLDNVKKILSVADAESNVVVSEAEQLTPQEQEHLEKDADSPEKDISDKENSGMFEQVCKSVEKIGEQGISPAVEISLQSDVKFIEKDIRAVSEVPLQSDQSHEEIDQSREGKSTADEQKSKEYASLVKEISEEREDISADVIAEKSSCSATEEKILNTTVKKETDVKETVEAKASLKCENEFNKIIEGKFEDPSGVEVVCRKEDYSEKGTAQSKPEKKEKQKEASDRDFEACPAELSHEDTIQDYTDDRHCILDSVAQQSESVSRSEKMKLDLNEPLQKIEKTPEERTDLEALKSKIQKERETGIQFEESFTSSVGSNEEKSESCHSVEVEFLPVLEVSDDVSNVSVDMTGHEASGTPCSFHKEMDERHSEVEGSFEEMERNKIISGFQLEQQPSPTSPGQATIEKAEFESVEKNKESQLEKMIYKESMSHVKSSRETVQSVEVTQFKEDRTTEVYNVPSERLIEKFASKKIHIESSADAGQTSQRLNQFLDSVTQQDDVALPSDVTPVHKRTEEWLNKSGELMLREGSVFEGAEMFEAPTLEDEPHKRSSPTVESFDDKARMEQCDTEVMMQLLDFVSRNDVELSEVRTEDEAPDIEEDVSPTVEEEVFSHIVGESSKSEEKHLSEDGKSQEYLKVGDGENLQLSPQRSSFDSVTSPSKREYSSENADTVLEGAHQERNGRFRMHPQSSLEVEVGSRGSEEAAGGDLDREATPLSFVEEESQVRDMDGAAEFSRTAGELQEADTLERGSVTIPESSGQTVTITTLERTSAGPEIIDSSVVPEQLLTEHAQRSFEAIVSTEDQELPDPELGEDADLSCAFINTAFAGAELIDRVEQAAPARARSPYEVVRDETLEGGDFEQDADEGEVFATTKTTHVTRQFELRHRPLLQNIPSEISEEDLVEREICSPVSRRDSEVIDCTSHEDGVASKPGIADSDSGDLTKKETVSKVTSTTILKSCKAHGASEELGTPESDTGIPTSPLEAEFEQKSGTFPSSMTLPKSDDGDKSQDSMIVPTLSQSLTDKTLSAASDRTCGERSGEGTGGAQVLNGPGEVEYRPEYDSEDDIGQRRWSTDHFQQDSMDGSKKSRYSSVSDDVADFEIGEILKSDQQFEDIIERPTTPEPPVDEPLCKVDDEGFQFSAAATAKQGDDSQFEEGDQISSPALSPDEDSKSAGFAYGMRFEKDVVDAAEESMDVDSDPFSDDKDSAAYAYGMRFERDEEEDLPCYGDLYTHVEEDEDVLENGERAKIPLKPKKDPDFDILAGRKYFSKNVESDEMSTSSLQEFEQLEDEIRSLRKSSVGSVDSLNGKQVTSKSGDHDDVSMSSLTEFERLERECLEVEKIDPAMQESITQLSEIEEGHESQASETSQENRSEDCREDVSIADDYDRHLDNIGDMILEKESKDEMTIQYILHQTPVAVGSSKDDPKSFDPTVKRTVATIEKRTVPSQRSQEMSSKSEGKSDDIDQDSLHEDFSLSLKPDSLTEDGKFLDSLHEGRCDDDSLQGDIPDEMRDSLFEDRHIEEDSLLEMDILPDESSLSMESSFAAAISHDSSKAEDVLRGKRHHGEAASQRMVGIGSAIVSRDGKTEIIVKELPRGDVMLSSTDSLEQNSSVAAAAFHFESESAMSTSLTGALASEDNTMISSTDTLEHEGRITFRYEDIPVDDLEILVRDGRKVIVDSEGNIQTEYNVKHFLDSEENLNNELTLGGKDLSETKDPSQSRVHVQSTVSYVGGLKENEFGRRFEQHDAEGSEAFHPEEEVEEIRTVDEFGNPKVIRRVKKVVTTRTQFSSSSSSDNVEEKMKEFLREHAASGQAGMAEEVVQEERSMDDKGNVVLVRTVQQQVLSAPEVHSRTFTGPDAAAMSEEFVRQYRSSDETDDVCEFEKIDEQGNVVRVTQQVVIKPEVHSVSFSGPDAHQQMEDYMKRFSASSQNGSGINGRGSSQSFSSVRISTTTSQESVPSESASCDVKSGSEFVKTTVSVVPDASEGRVLHTTTTTTLISGDGAPSVPSTSSDQSSSSVLE